MQLSLVLLLCNTKIGFKTYAQNFKTGMVKVHSNRMLATKGEDCVAYSQRRTQISVINDQGFLCVPCAFDAIPECIKEEKV